jgi:hypothetical protein
MQSVAFAGAFGAASGDNISVGVSSSSSSTSGQPPATPSSRHSKSSHQPNTAARRQPAPSCPLVPLSAGLPPGGPTPGQWYVNACYAQNIHSTGLYWIPYSTNNPAPAAPVDPLTLAEQAASSITLPQPMIYTNPSGSTYVNFPTWLWVDSTTWHPYVATASAGGVTATAVATPSSVYWSMGDGSTVVCQGPGTPYQSDKPSNQQNTSCSYEYPQSSAGQPSPNGDPNDDSYPVTATITWAVSWTATGAPGGGTLPFLKTQSTTPLRVEQVESIDTAP